MDAGHLPFPQPIHASWPIETLLLLRNAGNDLGCTSADTARLNVDIA